MNEKISLGDFLTEEEIERALKLYRQSSHYNFAKLCDEQIVTPNIERINKKLKQQNDPRYLAYAIQYCIEQVAQCRGRQS